MNGIRVLLVGFVVASGFTRGAEPQRFGIDKRVPWTTSKVTGSPEPPLPFVTEQVFPELKSAKLVELDRVPGTNRLVVGELNGKYYTFENRPDVNERALFYDLSKYHGKIRRNFGLTFHPNYEKNRYCFIAYAIGEGIPDGTSVSRFVVKDTNPPTIDPESEQVVISWVSGGHNGCCLKFGPDGYLYISAGDGGPAFPPDPLKSGQDLSTLMATIMRIDVDRPSKDRLYSIPSDNPFVDREGARGEIWCYGLRNPWRMSFDPNTGELWVGDVGWEMWEMIYRIQKGGNYGWSVVEGPQPVHRERPLGPTPILPPTIQHSHIESRSITGGFVYTGSRLKDLVGRYIYGDYVTGKVWAARFDENKILDVEEIADTPFAIVSFGLDHDNEIYIVDHAGTMHWLVPNPKRESNRDFPDKLSKTGLFSSVKEHRPAPGVIPYSIRAEPWADHTTAERFLAIPGMGKLDEYEKSNAQVGFLQGNWEYPTDSVLVKTISLEMEQGNPKSKRRLETQILHFDVDTWRAYTYIWNDEQTDAVLADSEGAERTFHVQDPDSPGGKRTQTWRFASRSECLLCHSTRGGSIYGFKRLQLDKKHAYGDIVADQLGTLEHIGLFVHPVERKEPMPNPYDDSADLTSRARSYLHVNCAHCHRRGGGGTAAIDIQYEFTLPKTNLLDARPTQGTFGLFAAEVLAPSDPYRSVLYYRMAKLGRGRMPHFGSTIVDEPGLRLMHDWIASLPSKDDTNRARVEPVRKRQAKLIEQIVAAKEPGQKIKPRVAELLASTSGALILLHAIDDNRLSSDQKKYVIDVGASHPEAVIRDLYERFLPEEKRTKRLGTTINSKELLSLKGQAERGRELFLTAKSVQCRNCHTLDGKGHELGPDLGKIGKKYDRAKLLENILQPSKEIEPKYVSYLVETDDGMVHTGLLLEKTEKEVVLKDVQLKEIRIPAKSVELMTPLQKSIMPDLLLRDMTKEEVADLLAFLASLK